MVVPDAPRIRGLEGLWETSGSDRITCPRGRFGAARDRGRRTHGGIDLDAHFEPVGAAMAGQVAFAGRSSARTGNLVVIDHGHGVRTHYAHLDSIDVHVGQSVERRSRIGVSGKTGTASPHLHYEVRVDGQSVDPSMPIDARDRASSRRSRAGRSVVGANRPEAPSLDAVYRIAVPPPERSRSARPHRRNDSMGPAQTPVNASTPVMSTPEASSRSRSAVATLFDWVAGLTERLGFPTIAETIRATAAALAIAPAAEPTRRAGGGARSGTGEMCERAGVTACVGPVFEEAPSRAPASKRPRVAIDAGRSIADELSA